MFRNFYDKFALSYVLLYSFTITCSLIIFRNKFKRIYPLFAFIFFLIVLINFIPVKSIVNSPLWRTESIYRMMNIPTEYEDFMGYIQKNISPTNTILSLPFGTSTYTVIKDQDTENVY